MRGQMPIALLAIVFGALETVGAVQELIYRGILASQTEPLIIGALGTVAGCMLLAAGIALLVSSPLTAVLAPAAAYVSIPVFILSGVVKHYAGWPITLVGIAYPLILLFFCKKFARPGSGLSRS